MSDNDHQSTPPHDDQSSSAMLGAIVGNGSHHNATHSVPGDASRGLKRMRPEDEEDDDEKPRPDRRKIEIKFIQDKSRRHITFSKRKAGIMKKAYELSVLTGTQVLLLVVSETGLVYTFTTPKLQPLVTKSEGKNLIQACLNAPEPSSHHAENGVEDIQGVDEGNDEAAHARQQNQQQQAGHRNAVGMPPYHFPDHQQAAYQHLLAAQQAQHHVQQAHQQAQRGTGYSMAAHPLGAQMQQHPAQAS